MHGIAAGAVVALALTFAGSAHAVDAATCCYRRPQLSGL